MAGGNSGGITSVLPIAAALAATVATDGAASPWLVDAMGATAAGALTSGAAAAAASGITAALTGQNVGRAALMGGIGGGVGGAMGTSALGSEATANAAAAANASGGIAPLTGSNVAGNAALNYANNAGIAQGTGNLALSGYGVEGGTLGTVTPQAVSDAVANGTMTQAQAAAYGQGYTQGFQGVTPQMAGTVPAGAAAAGGSGMSNMAKWGLGATALGALITADNKKYGVPSPASQEYTGPLSKLHYDPNKYTPLTAQQPDPAYQPTYANYVAHPYNAYAAEGGKVVAMAAGGLADANPMQNPSIGPVEQMSRDNAVGQNQMFPQSNINSPAFSSATNTPMGSNMIAPSGDTNVDPYTGAERFADGGLAATPEAQQVQLPPGVPQGIPLQAMPNAITQNAVNTNNAFAQDLIARMAARNAANPVPGQTPPVVPTGIMAAAPYAPPTFDRPTNVAPIQFQNPKAIVGTKAYNDEQARLAAEAEAQRQAQMAAMGGGGGPDYGSGGGDGGGDGGGEAAGGLMKSYSGTKGSMVKGASDMSAIDDYVTQYQSDPAAVMAKAKNGDWNAMIALNKINKTPNQNYAQGGNVANLGGYAAGGNPRLLKGPGDGMSDNIPATIGGKQPARLADGEFVVPADVVSHLGNGSTDAGAKHLYDMMNRVRKARTGNKKQGKQIKPEKYLKA